MHFEDELVEGTFAPVAARFCGGASLTYLEKAEVLRIAQGLSIKDSAADEGVSPETIRARRKRIYRKLRAIGANELIADLLAYTLALLAHGTRVRGGTFSPPSDEREALIGKAKSSTGAAA